MCFALQAVSSVGGLAFFLASLHPFTRGVSATFVRSFLTPTVRTAPAAGRGNAIPGYGEGLGGAHRGAALRQALESSTGDRYASAEFLAHTSDIWNWPSWLVEWGNEALRWQLARPYGMFIRMTGTDGSRPEVTIEAAARSAGPWTELPFRYKPTDPLRSLPWTAPHNPRIDYSLYLASVSATISLASGLHSSQDGSEIVADRAAAKTRRGSSPSSARRSWTAHRRWQGCSDRRTFGRRFRTNRRISCGWCGTSTPSRRFANGCGRGVGR